SAVGLGVVLGYMAAAGNMSWFSAGHAETGGGATKTSTGGCSAENGACFSDPGRGMVLAMGDEKASRTSTEQNAPEMLLAQGKSGGQASASNGKKPNILVIFGDDIGISDVSVYSDGLMGFETPNIDRIAKEGLRFL